MKYIIPALILSIFLHLLIFKTYKIKDDEIKDNPSSTKNPKKSDIKYVVLKSVAKKVEPKIAEPKKESTKEKVEKKEPIKKLVKEKPIYKKVKKSDIKVAKKREVKKEEVKKTSPKPIQKTEINPNYTKLNPTKLQKDTLEDFLSTPVQDVKMLDELTQSYIKLYGEEYNSFTKVQKVFLQKNLKNIGKITEKYLRYPDIAVRTRQSGMNIIEFTLYPNGDITKPMITSSSGYETLDENTIETIEIAYKDYPRPKEPTKIRIYVTYRLY